MPKQNNCINLFTIIIIIKIINKIINININNKIINKNKMPNTMRRHFFIDIF